MRAARPIEPDDDEGIVLVLDYSGRAVPKSTLMASHRPATGGRGIRVGGTVYSELTPAVECRDCHQMVDGALVQGRHAPRAVEGVMRNCAGKELKPWP